MAPAYQTPPQMNRSGSFELGSPSLLQKYNKKTGRPIRRSAGRVKSLAGYVDSSAIIDIEDDEPLESSDDDDGETIKTKRIKKRKRLPSTSPPPLDPIIYDESADEPSDEEPIGHHIADLSPITLQFNVPLGFHGPLVVKLDRSLLFNNTDGGAHDMHSRKVRRKVRAVTPEPENKEPVVVVPKTGFCDLPPELRNKVYRHVFVAEQGFHFPAISPMAKPLCRSAQFLRTCRLVHSEVCSILYGENEFSFTRNRTTRGALWEPQPKEIGYTDIRRFLKMIGPENLAYLRVVKFAFEDATAASTPYMLSHEERRFLNDKHLFDCLRTLRCANLRKLTLCFYGRRALSRTDVKFVDYLERIKADEVDTSPGLWYLDQNKIHAGLWDHLRERMTRRKKLYTQD